MNTIIKLDTRGRLVIPNEFRETLDLKKGDNVLISLNYDTNTISISPIYEKSKNLIKIEMEFGDKPGCLANIAKIIADQKIDIIMSESKSSQRGTKARWDIIADFSNSNKTINELKQIFLQSGYIEKVSINKISRGCLHC